MKKVFVEKFKQPVEHSSFSLVSLKAIQRLEAGKGIVQSIEERFNSIFNGSIPTELRRKIKSLHEVVGISTDLPRDSCLIDVGFLQREKKILEELRMYGPEYIEKYSKYLLELLVKDNLTINNDHELYANWHGYRSLRISPAIIPDKDNPNKKHIVVLIYKKKDGVLYLANIGYHDAYDTRHPDQLRFVKLPGRPKTKKVTLGKKKDG